ncbi:hypothetical protein K435DRAFT_813815 [Dendrothele bispora CBS 962.96]|uniref:Uncharacterized protein n=1 Tax=Dendrothele bispora (strain CBS 962.96) TaxID=1314807 RepID=A0A4S8KKL9_DENBC|nr:hypothetical protein K435DRAFT_813815 [Dendrothele bispora CBS 962.96]
MPGLMLGAVLGVVLGACFVLPSITPAGSAIAPGVSQAKKPVKPTLNNEDNGFLQNTQIYVPQYQSPDCPKNLAYKVDQQATQVKLSRNRQGSLGYQKLGSNEV